MRLRYPLTFPALMTKIKNATPAAPDQNDRVLVSGYAKVATCGGRLLVSDHRHMGLKLREDRHVRLLRRGCIYRV